MHAIASRIITPDGTILQSFTQHDYKSHTDLNGKTYGIDGGLSYQRIIGDSQDLEIICITDEDPFELVRREMYWGTYGKTGDQPFKRVYLYKMSNDHIKAILQSQPLPEWTHILFTKELKYRKNKNINIEDTK